MLTFRLPPVCVIWYFFISSTLASQCYLRFLSAHKHSKVNRHRHSVSQSVIRQYHLTDRHTHHQSLVTGATFAVVADKHRRLVLHCHWILSFLSRDVSEWVCECVCLWTSLSIPLCATPLSTLKAATRYWCDEFLRGCVECELQQILQQILLLLQDFCCIALAIRRSNSCV